MTLDDIKSYDDMTAYIKEVGAENLTDEDIKLLNAKVIEIRTKRFEEIDKKSISDSAKASLKMVAISDANNWGYYLGRCTPQRKYDRLEQIQRALKQAGLKEAEARERERMLD